MSLGEIRSHTLMRYYSCITVVVDRTMEHLRNIYDVLFVKHYNSVSITAYQTHTYADCMVTVSNVIGTGNIRDIDHTAVYYGDGDLFNNYCLLCAMYVCVCI
eukprot:562953_1